jgi:hypothetical protein
MDSNSEFSAGNILYFYNFICFFLLKKNNKIQQSIHNFSGYDKKKTIKYTKKNGRNKKFKLFRELKIKNYLINQNSKKKLQMNHIAVKMFEKNPF